MPLPQARPASGCVQVDFRSSRPTHPSFANSVLRLSCLAFVTTFHKALQHGFPKDRHLKAYVMFWLEQRKKNVLVTLTLARSVDLFFACNSAGCSRSPAYHFCSELR